MAEEENESGLVSSKNERPFGLRIVRNAMVPLAHEDGTARHFGPYKPVINACNTCPARCCRYTVKVSIPDALEFCVTLGLPFFAGLQLLQGDGPRSFKVDLDPRVFPDASQEHWTGAAEIALRRRPDGGCAHLLDINGFERCGVYSARPSTCRLYPVVWESDRAEGGPPMISCPVAYGMTPAMEEQFYEDAAKSIVNWELHDEIVAQWHQRDKEESNWEVMTFLEFALSMASTRMGLDSSEVLRPGSAYERLADAMRSSGTLK